MRTRLEIGELRYTVSADECGKGKRFPRVYTKEDRVFPNVVVLTLLLYPGTKPFLPGNLPVPVPVHQHVEKVTS